MKWMIASDLHGSAYWCEKMVERYKEEGAGKLLLLGDILYHGPRNDLPKDYAPNDSKDDLKSLLLVDSALRITALGDTVTIQSLSAGTFLFRQTFRILLLFLL